MHLPRGHRRPPNALAAHRATEYTGMGQLRRYRLPRGRGKKPRTRAVQRGAAPRGHNSPHGAGAKAGRSWAASFTHAPRASSSRPSRWYPKAPPRGRAERSQQRAAAARPGNRGHRTPATPAPGTTAARTSQPAPATDSNGAVPNRHRPTLAKSFHKTCRQLAHGKRRKTPAATPPRAPATTPSHKNVLSPQIPHTKRPRDRR